MEVPDMVKNVRNVNTFQQTAGNYARYGAILH